MKNADLKKSLLVISIIFAFIFWLYIEFFAENNYQGTQAHVPQRGRLPGYWYLNF